MPLQSAGSKPKSILLATDLTAAGDRAFHRAVQLATGWDASLTICHVVEASSTRPIGIERRIRNVEADMSELEKRARASLKRAVSRHVVIGDAAERVIEHAKAIESDFVVTGPTHAKAFDDKLLGSTAGRILRLADVPVLSVRRRATGAYTNVAVSVDFSSTSQHAVAKARALFPTAMMTLVHAYEVKPDWTGRNEDKPIDEVEAAEREKALHIAQEEIARLVGKGDGRMKTRLIEGRPGPVLAEFVEEERPDLVVTGTYGRADAEGHVIGSTAELLLNTLTCDVLAIRPEG
jgi:nucleotide-binding universal stress UspA family protein